VVDWLRVRDLPYMARHNYYYEFVHLLPWGLLVAVVEGNLAANVIARAFSGTDLQVAIASATPPGSLLVSLVWGMWCVGRPKLRLTMIASTLTGLFAATAAFTPRAAWGAWLFLLQIIAANLFLTGVVTVRAALWKSNYPPTARGRITARLQAVRAISKIAALTAAAAILDRDANAYRYIYPACAVAGAASLAWVRRLHVRGERRELRGYRTAGSSASAEDIGAERLLEPFNVWRVFSPRHLFGEMIEILRRDRAFRVYCSAQMLLGISNLMMRPVLVVMLERDLLSGADFFYRVSTILMDVLPTALMMATLPRWGRFFDRVGVVRQRVYIGVFWVIATVFGTLGALATIGGPELRPWCLPLAIGLFALYAMFSGAGQGGGTLAWNIGHLHFAAPHEAEVYMGIHVSLTGLRGMLAPLLGTLLWTQVAWWTWLVSLAFATWSLMSYIGLLREQQRQEATLEAHGRT